MASREKPIAKKRALATLLTQPDEDLCPSSLTDLAQASQRTRTLQAFPRSSYPGRVIKMPVQVVLTGPHAKTENTPVADSKAHIPKHEIILSVV
jgi:hypothetical protein